MENIINNETTTRIINLFNERLDANVEINEIGIELTWGLFSGFFIMGADEHKVRIRQYKAVKINGLGMQYKPDATHSEAEIEIKENDEDLWNAIFDAIDENAKTLMNMDD